jgi:hypothetical protein
MTARQHWYVENKLHWSLDVALRRGVCKTHRGYAAENLARVLHIALNYLKGETNFKRGIPVICNPIPDDAELSIAEQGVNFPTLQRAILKAI